MLTIIETDVDHRIAAGALFDRTTSDTAFAELDARYPRRRSGATRAHLAGPSRRAYAGLNQGELPCRIDRTWVNIDHRHVTNAMGLLTIGTRTPTHPGDPCQRVSRSTSRLCINSVTSEQSFLTHRSSDATSKAAVRRRMAGRSISSRSKATASIVARSSVNQTSTLHSAKFEELQPFGYTHWRAAAIACPQYGRYNAHFAARDWDALIPEVLAEDHRERRSPTGRK